jgi:arsenite oxidase small subunit
MERREFLTTCAVLGGASLLAFDAAKADTPPRWYSRTLLTDVHGRPVRTRDLAPDTNYVFQYPFAATPCLLVKLSRPAAATTNLKREDGAGYAWQGGVGEDRNVVAFSAICAHKLAYPTREVSFIRYQRERSATSSAQVIHCCADHSVYDPAQGARVLAGPAPQPLAAILLEYDSAADGLYALGTLGAEQFDAFFTKYRLKLSLEYGGDGGRTAVRGTSILRELANYCRTTIQC